jgi:hypothetical protein
LPIYNQTEGLPFFDKIILKKQTKSLGRIPAGILSGDGINMKKQYVISGNGAVDQPFWFLPCFLWAVKKETPSHWPTPKAS